MISPDGLVLTNSHVVDGARELRLTDPEGRSMEARLLGEDPDTDLALLRAGAARNLPSAALGDSKRLRRGQLAVAIGNPLGFEFDRDRRRDLGARPLACGRARAG